MCMLINANQVPIIYNLQYMAFDKYSVQGAEHDD